MLIGLSFTSLPVPFSPSRRPQPLQDEVRQAFARSIRTIWLVVIPFVGSPSLVRIHSKLANRLFLSQGGVGLILSLFMRSIKLQTQTDEVSLPFCSLGQREKLTASLNVRRTGALRSDDRKAMPRSRRRQRRPNRVGAARVHISFKMARKDLNMYKAVNIGSTWALKRALGPVSLLGARLSRLAVDAPRRHCSSMRYKREPLKSSLMLRVRLFRAQ